MVLAGGARQPRDLPIPGRELEGIHFACRISTFRTDCAKGDEVRKIVPERRGQAVVIIGGWDTGADCLGTAHGRGPRRSRNWSCCRVRRMSWTPKRIPGLSILRSFA